MARNKRDNEATLFSPEERVFIVESARTFLRGHRYELYAFGSRIKGNARCGSDLDLVVKSSEHLDAKNLALLKEAFEESSLPYAVDLLDARLLSEDFLSTIMEEAELLDRK